MKPWLETVSATKTLSAFAQMLFSDDPRRNKEKKRHQRVVILLHMQRQAEQVAGLSLDGRTLQTLHVRLQGDLVQVLDFQSLAAKTNTSI